MKIKEKISLNNAVGWTSSAVVSYNHEGWIRKISTDSRTIEKGDFFIPVKGDNFDGHDYISMVVSSGASGFVYEKRKKEKVVDILKGLDKENPDRLMVLETYNSMDFLKDLAAGYLKQFGAVTIGITGSLGKTTTKSFISAVLSRDFNIVSTPKNYNTEIGVSKTIFDIDRSTDYFIAELGMRGPGQIGPLAEMSNVSIGAITSVSGSHMEFFKSMEKLATAKAEIAVPIKRNGGIMFLNADDRMTPHIKEIIEVDILEFGENKKRDYNFVNVGSDWLGRFSFDFFRKDIRLVRIKCSHPGYHNLYNGVLAAAVCYHVGADIDMIKEGIENAEMEEHRMHVLKCGDIIVLDDCYNASPVSVKSALDTVSVISGNKKRRSIAVLGDMLELGDSGPQLHYDTGLYAAKKGIDVLITSGKLAQNMCRGFEQGTVKKDRCFTYMDQKSLRDELKNIVKAGDIILVKGSRANKLEEIVNFLKYQVAK